MSAKEKISKSLTSAITYLENSILALNKKDDKSFADNIWHVGAELEYALFLFSTILHNESTISKWKPNPELKKAGIDKILTEAQKLLNASEKHMANEKLPDSYKNAYIARHHILKAQEDLAKKKREELKKK